MTNGNIIPWLRRVNTVLCYVCFFFFSLELLDLCNLFWSNVCHRFGILAFYPFRVQAQTITTMIALIITFLLDNKNHKKRVNVILFFYVHVLIATSVNWCWCLWRADVHIKNYDFAGNFINTNIKFETTFIFGFWTMQIIIIMNVKKYLKIKYQNEIIISLFV